MMEPVLHSTPSVPSSSHASSSSQPAATTPSTDDLKKLFATDPVTAASTIAADVASQIAVEVATQIAGQMIDQAMRSQLSTLKDEAELRGAIQAFRKANPDVASFEPFVLQEVATLLQTDDDGALDDWDVLLTKALAIFREKFKETVKENAGELPNQPFSKLPHMEGGAARQLPEALPSFTRQQIASMTPAEFAANEAAIELALQHGRIN